MQELRTNTATRITVGPFLSNTDGVTPKTTLTVTSEKLTFIVDDAGVPTLVLDTAPTASSGNNDMVHITGDDAGYYDLELTAANVNYLGRAKLSLNDATTHCPVFHEFMILSAIEYDRKYSTIGFVRQEALEVIRQFENYILQIKMTDANGVGQTGLTLSAEQCKTYEIFGAITPTIYELSDGFYEVWLDKDLHCSAVGSSRLRFTGGGFVCEKPIQIVPEYTVLANVTNIAGLTVEPDAEAIAAEKIILPASLASPTNITDADVNVATWNNLTAVALPLVPTVPGRTLDVTTNGNAGIDIGNVDNPTTTLTLSGTTVKTATDVETKVTDVQGRLPGALTGAGNMKSDAVALSGDTTAADNAESFFDGTGYAGTNNVIPVVTTVNGLGANVITAASMASDAGAEIAAAVWNEDATGHQTQGTFGQAIGDPVADTNTIYKAVVTDAAGANVAADIIAMKVDTAAILVDTGTTLDAALAVVDGIVDSIKLVTDKQNDTLEDQGGGVFGFTEAALQEAPTATGPTASDIASAVWEEAIADHDTAGSTGEQLAAAASAGDPWIADLSGYTGSQAGKIVHDNLDAAVSSRASQASLDTIDGIVDTILVDTNELQTDWVNGGRLDNILDARASQSSVDTVDGIVDSVVADTNELQTDWANGGRLDNILDARASQSSVDTVDGIVDSVVADTNELQGDWANGGRLDLILDARASQSSVDDIPTNAEFATAMDAVPTVVEIRTEMDSNSTKLSAIVGDTDELQADWVNGGRLDLILDARASQTSVDDLPTNAELATSQAAADGATLTAIGDLPTAAEIRAELDSNSTKLDSILTDTAEIGTAGAGLTNINLPNQTMDIVGNITGNLSGSVGSVTGLTAAHVAAIKVIADRINALIEDSSGDRFTGKALEAAPDTGATAVDIRTEMDSNSTKFAAILADTNELQTDWVNGGRLDNILDARSSQTSVDDIPTVAELAASQAAADDATLAAISSAQSAIITLISALNNIAAGAPMTLTSGERSQIAAAIVNRTLVQSYAADGVAPTVTQALCAILSGLFEFKIQGTTITNLQWNGTDTAFTSTIDDAERPMMRTRAT